MIFKYVISVILFVYSYFPFFAITDDSNFGTLDISKIHNKENLRFSIVNLMLGDFIIYFLTWNFKNRCMDILHIIKLRDIPQFIISEEVMDTKLKQYGYHLKILSEKDVSLEKEKLLYHIANEEQRVSISNGKINLYATIILTVLPLMLAMTDLKKFFNLHIFGKITIGFLVYILLNVILYIFQSVKIQEIKKSSFKDLKEKFENSNKKKICVKQIDRNNHKNLNKINMIELNKQYYYDWQHLHKKADLSVSYSKNMQYFIYFLLSFLILFFIVLIVI